MWKASVGKQIEIKTPKNDDNDDDWETDPDFINDVTEQEQRWGSKTVEGSGRDMGAIDMKQLRYETELAEAERKKKQREEDANNPAFGYGGKFGIQADRMDQSAVGHDYIAKLEKHVSQKDYSTGFGGKFGVQTDRVDKSAENWDYKEKIDKHASQKDYTTGFGGKFGVQADRQDKSAVGWDHVEKVDKHESQKDYSVGFGGKFGIQADRQDKSAVGWDHHEKLPHHESQTDHKVGFGGKFGVQTDRMDKSAVAFTDAGNVGTAYAKTKPDIGGAKPSDLRAKFENMIQSDPKEPEKKVTTSGKLDMSKTAMFTKKTEDPLPKISPVRSTSVVNKFVQKVQESEEKVEKKVIVEEAKVEKKVIVEETKVEPVKKIVEAVVEEEPVKVEEPVKSNEEVVETTEEVAELEDTGLVAVALYDYQSAADDEISFDPEDVITHVEMIDEGWWRGLCHEKYGLFPANYVQLINKNP